MTRLGTFSPSLTTGIPASKQLLTINGGSANIPGKTYGVFQVGIWIAARQTTVLDFTIWMPLLDTAHAITIPSPTTSEVVLTNTYMPGLELQIPANTVIRDYDGNIVNTIGMTPIPPDRPPFPLPIGVEVPIYFTIQPGGAYLYTASGERQGARLIYPNSVGQPPGARFDFWNYGLQNLDWYIYGHGTVSPDGKQVMPDPGVQIYGFTGAMVGGPSLAPPSPNPPAPPNCCLLGYPVDPSTGLVIETHTDFFLPDIIPIDFSRTYRSGDQRSRPFGIGATDSYEVFLVGNILPWTYQYLILQDGSRVYFPRTSPGTGFSDAVYQNTTAPGPWFGSVITYNGAGWNLKRRDGTTYVFPDSFQTTNPAKAAVIKIIDRNGNTLTITRDSNGNITQVISPNGRWLQFTHDSTNRITQIQDNIGRTVNYAYNSNGQLATFTDQNSGTTRYIYQNALFQIFDPRGNKITENQYDTAGRLVSQSMQDRAWRFSYTLDANNNVTKTTIHDPRDIKDEYNYQVYIDPGDGSAGSSNANGFLSSQRLAFDKPEHQVFTYQRDPNSRVLQSVTDQLGRQTSYTYDSFGT
jgi:YD repeat-containing protein